MNQESKIQDLCIAYFRGKRWLISLGFGPEIDWQEDADPLRAVDADVFREGAWAILSCGLSEHAVRSVFGEISGIFGYWQAPSAVVAEREQLLEEASQVFRHRGKLGAIAELAYFISENGATHCIELLAVDPASFGRAVPFFGPASTRHLKKSLGFPVAKPDRHLLRLSARFGTSVDDLCASIASYAGEKPSVVDLVLWRLCERKLDTAVFGSLPDRRRNLGQRPA